MPQRHLSLQPVVRVSQLDFFLDGYTRLREAASAAELTAILQQAAGDYGLEVMVFGPRDRPALFANTFPDEWMKTWIDEEMGGYDPLVTRASERLLSSTWKELHAARPVTKREQAVVELCREFGWNDGFCVPVRGPGGYLALSVMAGSQADFSDQQRELLAFLVLTAHERYRELMRLEWPQARKLLSPRERDCLSFVAAGKTDGAIATRLGIGETTVRWHIDNARRKLGAATRAQAVAQAVWRGLIEP